MTFFLENDFLANDDSLEKLFSLSLALASSMPVIGLERVCPRKVGPWPRIFFWILGLGLEHWVLELVYLQYVYKLTSCI